MGNPYIQGNRIAYTSPNIFYTVGSERTPLTSRPSLPLPYQPPGSTGELQATAHYTGRVGPFSFRDYLFPGFADGEEPEGAELTSYATKVESKISNGAWDQVPYVGFVSPIYLSPRS